MAEIRIRGEPTADQQVCRFVVDHSLHGGNASFTSAAAAEGAPLAEALFALPDVSAVTIARDTVSVTKQGDAAWPEIGKLIGDAIRAQIASGEPAVGEMTPASDRKPRGPSKADEIPRGSANTHGQGYRKIQM